MSMLPELIAIFANTAEISGLWTCFYFKSFYHTNLGSKTLCCIDYLWPLEFN